MRARKTALRAWLPWLAPAFLLGAVLLGVFVVHAQPFGLFGTIAAVLFGLPLLWVVISTLWPAHADRACPQCKEDTLERLDPKTTHGLVCRACGYQDESASSWLLAEEEGPLEDVVLEQRGRKRGERRRSVVDSPHAAD